MGSPIDQVDLAVTLAVGQCAQETFGLTGEEFSEAVAIADSDDLVYSVGFLTRAPSTWFFLEIQIDGSSFGLAAVTPQTPEGLPPTSVSKLLVGGWMAEEDLVVDRGIAGGSRVVAVRAGGAQSDFTEQLLMAWAEAVPMAEKSEMPPLWLAKSQLHIAATSKIANPVHPGERFRELFLEVLSEVKNRWRFLSIYRLFEHGYLVALFDQLKRDFFANPRESLQSAIELADSEAALFVNLVQVENLNFHFERIFDDLEVLVKDGNRFGAAIQRSIQGASLLREKPGKATNGVLIAYKIRCAIVHAGASNPIFDAFPDGRACLVALLPHFELAMMQFLEISTP